MNVATDLPNASPSRSPLLSASRSRMAMTLRSIKRRVVLLENGVVQAETGIAQPVPRSELQRVHVFHTDLHAERSRDLASHFASTSTIEPLRPRVLTRTLCAWAARIAHAVSGSRWGPSARHDSALICALAGRVSDSGEGRWTMMAAIDGEVPTPVLITALTERFASRGAEDFANKLLSALRDQFGGHEEKHS